MTNREVAQVLAKIADILEIKDDNPFKIRAYRNAANAIFKLEENINDLHRLDRIGDIPGVGKAVKAKIEEMLNNGSCEYYGRLLDEVPEGVLQMLFIPGLGHKTVRIIFYDLGIKNLEELLIAAKQHEIRKLPGLGSKTEYNIIKGMEMLAQSAGKATLGMAKPLAEELKKYLLSIEAVSHACIVGSLRRGKPLVSDIDILAAAEDFSAVYDHVSKYPGLVAVNRTQPDLISGKLTYNIDFEVIVVEPVDFFPYLVWTTGSKTHRKEIFKNVDIKNLRGLTSEEEVYKKLGYPYIPPELRENTGEIEAARAYTLPVLIECQDIKGDLHMHSSWSDGGTKIEDMREAAREMNYDYIAITDHSKSLPISGGLNEERLTAQAKVIDALNQQTDSFAILKGIEADILKDGQLDFDDKVLSELDIVVASIHSNFNLDKDKQTERIISAMKNENTNVIGHLTGRLLNRRKGYEINIEPILETARKNNVALEINSHPDRLDIDAEIARQAKDYGVKIAVNSDAHHKEDLKLIQYGIMNARRGWLETDDVINTWNKDRLMRFLHKK
ncbi:MAG TPA: DNA polymerase/3'-5' exonuclease PolX [Syntrophomonadaceae bacterium]|nr:DNA polymerase/3'-5' exonuclease PolX [Syntrophomonadaceae bacterium]HNX29249.1 DNA polymerase/3'-5' exonuclease PolX [Syntrophomonadaceae bacterium]HPR94109.1 DNA polymerase/3'-5' exonuclease PolX [Syntrophomonadaceae bacterium]